MPRKISDEKASPVTVSEIHRRAAVIVLRVRFFHDGSDERTLERAARRRDGIRAKGRVRQNECLPIDSQRSDTDSTPTYVDRGTESVTYSR